MVWILVNCGIEIFSHGTSNNRITMTTDLGFHALDKRHSAFSGVVVLNKEGGKHLFGPRYVGGQQGDLAVAYAEL